jgi:RNA polymerase sigma-70 factor (ECF subfamily)
VSLADSSRVAEQAAREYYGEILAWLAWRWKDLGAAEDALGDAFERALRYWPTRGVPQKPKAWLLQVAQRQLLQKARREGNRSLEPLDDIKDCLVAPDELDLPDCRLGLLLACAHPALDPSIHAPLMLQTVLGLQAEQIAPALLLSTEALAQRLVRAKRKIRASGIRLEQPDLQDLPGRLHSLLEAIYGSYGLAWEALQGCDQRLQDLDEEALYLARLLTRLRPDDAECLGLLATLSYCQARKRARQSGGAFVPLARQETQLWDGNLLVEAESLLWKASKLGRIGPFQLEAAVQSAHCQRFWGKSTPWQEIALLYRELNRQAPRAGSKVAEAVAWLEAGRLGECENLLEQQCLPEYQPWWMARAHLERRRGNLLGSREAFERAKALSPQPKIQNYIDGLLSELSLVTEALP